MAMTQVMNQTTKREDWFEGADLWAIEPVSRSGPHPVARFVLWILRVIAIAVGLLVVRCSPPPSVRALLLDAPAKPAVTLDLVCDAGGNSGCSEAALRQ